MRVILLEFIDEARAVLKKFGPDFLRQKDVRVVCLHPKVGLFLKQQGLPFEDTIPFFNNDAQHRICLFSEKLALNLIRDLSIVDSFGIKQGYEERAIHHTRLYITHFLWIIEILKGVAEKYRPTEIICGQAKKRESLYTNQAFIQDCERFLGELAENFCQVKNILFTAIPVAVSKPAGWQRLVIILVHSVAQLISRCEYRGLMARLKGVRDIVAVPATSYRMDILLKEIKQQHPSAAAVMIWEGGGPLRKELSRLYAMLKAMLKRQQGPQLLAGLIDIDLIKDRVRKDDALQKTIHQKFDRLLQSIAAEENQACRYEGVSFAQYLKDKIGHGLRNEMLALQHSTLTLAGIFREIRPRLLMSMYSSGIYFMMGELSHGQGFPSLNISHGTHVPPNNEIERIENYRLATNVIINPYKHVAVQTPWADKFLDYYKDRRPRILSGPLLYSKTNPAARNKFRQKLLGEKTHLKIVIHATTQKIRMGFRLHITETADEYLSTLTDIIQAVNRLEDVFFVLRPHPICDLSEKEMLALLPACPRMAIVREGPFSDILSAADLLISYSSTCIEEAIQNNIPVILFDKWSRYNHFNLPETKAAGSLTRSPAYYISRPDVLNGAMAGILKTFADNPLTDQELSAYKYPAEYKNHFFNFINQTFAVK
jgi:hypothetical protein